MAWPGSRHLETKKGGRGPVSGERARSRGTRWYTRIRGTVRLCGPALVAAVAYVDPGNVATNLTGGSRYGYLLVWVVVAANLMAGLVQYLSAKLGLVTGASLPALLGARLPGPARIAYWLQAELCAVATDLAEVVGGAVALWLLFGVPPVAGAVVTGALSMLLLGVQRRGQHRFEQAVIALLAVVAAGFVTVLAFRPPEPTAVLAGLVPRLDGSGSTLLAAGILGATVMPHAVYLHSALAVDRHAAHSAAPAGARAHRAPRCTAAGRRTPTSSVRGTEQRMPGAARCTAERQTPVATGQYASERQPAAVGEARSVVAGQATERRMDAAARESSRDPAPATTTHPAHARVPAAGGHSTAARTGDVSVPTDVWQDTEDQTGTDAGRATDVREPIDPTQAGGDRMAGAGAPRVTYPPTDRPVHPGSGQPPPTAIHPPQLGPVSASRTGEARPRRASANGTRCGAAAGRRPADGADRYEVVFRRRIPRLLAATRLDVGTAMLIAGAVNLAMLLLAATSLRGAGTDTLAGGYAAVSGRLGPVAAALFAVGMLASGLAATSVGSYAGAVVMAGLLRRRVPLLLRRLVTLVPAIAILAAGVDATRALVLSQVVLSFGIVFALVPLTVLTSRRTVLGECANRPATTVCAAAICTVVLALNLGLLVAGV